jgi:hypothetical protein
MARAEAYLQAEGYGVETIVLSAYLVVDGETLSAVEAAPAETPRELVNLMFWSAQSIAEDGGLI